MELTGINNIIFDLGDVIINIDHNKATLAFQKLVGSQFKEMEVDLSSNKILEKFETAALTTNEFISFFKSYNSNLTDQEIIDAWNTMLLDIPEERVSMINKIAKQYRIFLLSNTNEIHLKYIDDYVAKKFGMINMSQPFEKAYYSHKMRLRKPNPQIFQEILMDKKLNPYETLFIDDSEQHIITAKKLNLKTHHLLATETIIDIFKNEH